MRRSTVRVGEMGKGRKQALRSRGLRRRVADLDARVELIQALIPLGLEAAGWHSLGGQA